MFGGGEVWVLEAKSDTDRQSNLYELKGKLSAFLIVEQTTQKDPHAASPAHSQLTQPSPLSRVTRHCWSQKENVTKKELELQKATNVK